MRGLGCWGKTARYKNDQNNSFVSYTIVAGQVYIRLRKDI